jgi:hypothetical protein
MQNLRPESPIQLAERPLGLQRDPDAVEKFLRAPRATILVVLQNDLETGILHLQLVAPRPNTGEAFDPDLHFNSLTQTIIAKCEVGAFPTDTGSVAYNILRAEVMQDLQAMYPDVGNWDLILSHLLSVYAAAPHDTMYLLTTKPQQEITSQEFTPPELVVTYKA